MGAMLLLLVAGMLLSGCATPEDEYIRVKEQVQGAVNDWIIDHGIGRPPYGVAVNTTECSIYTGTYPDINAGYVLDFCYLLEYYTEDSDYFPFELPVCCYGQSGQEGTNFYTGNCTNPYQGHYIWLIDTNGNVCSVCVGDDCRANNESGYQGVWP